MFNLSEFIDTASKKDLEHLLSGVEKKLAEKGVIRSAKSAAGASFTVSGTVSGNKKFLTREQLETATRSFAEWCADAKNPLQKRSRNRLWMAFLLMRYGALRLGEVLALDDRSDIRPLSSQIVVKGSHERKVLLPKSVMHTIEGLIASPMYFSLRGQIFNLDPGYLRRKFYERARACSLPGKLFNPRVIRHSRAVELLCGGVPLQVVQSFLGQQHGNPAAAYLEFSGEAVHNIVKRYITRENKMKTSARNAFTGTVSKVGRDGLLVEVEITTMAGLLIVSVITEESFQNLKLAEGSIATATIKAPWVLVSLVDENHHCSARNQFLGTISEIKSTEVACEVVTDLADGTKVCALLTKGSLDAMALKTGMEIMVMFKAFSVIINTD